MPVSVLAVSGGGPEAAAAAWRWSRVPGGQEDEEAQGLVPTFQGW